MNVLPKKNILEKANVFLGKEKSSWYSNYSIIGHTIPECYTIQGMTMKII
jgi:hypothetical protein